MKTIVRIFALSCSIAALLPGSAVAQENGYATSGDFAKPPQPGQPAWQASAVSGYDFAGAAKYDGSKLGYSDAFNYRLQAGARVFLNDNWFLGLSLLSDNDALQQVPGAPVPADIHTLRLGLSVGYRVNDQWSFSTMVSPGLMSLDDVRGKDVTISGGALASYQVKPSLRLSFGLLGAPDSDIPVFPMAGARWQLTEQWTLEAGLPRTRLTYHLDRKLAFYGGADFNGTVFRAKDDLGNRIGRSEYNNALATYRDIRVGAGASYQFARGMSAEVEGGYSVFREIYYVRIDDHVRFDPAPYIKLAVSVRF